MIGPLSTRKIRAGAGGIKIILLDVCYSYGGYKRVSPYCKMVKSITFLIFLLSWTLSNAQTDTAFMLIRTRLISEYQIVLQQNNVYINEGYTFFKGRFWLDKIDTITLSGWTRTDSGYIDTKRNKTNFYRSYGICDPDINKIRNSASYFRMRNEVDNIARTKLGYDNKEFLNLRRDSFSRSHFFAIHCYNDFQNKKEKLRQEYTRIIDSLYSEKVTRLNLIKSNPTSITQSFVDSFISSFNYSDPDFRSLEIIIRDNTSFFVNSIHKLSESDFFSFTLKLDGFPDDMNLIVAKSALKKYKSKTKRERKIVRKMKNNKS